MLPYRLMYIKKGEKGSHNVIIVSPGSVEMNFRQDSNAADLAALTLKVEALEPRNPKMITRHLSKAFGFDRNLEIAASTREAAVDTDYIAPLIDFFTIGKKLRYFPEYKPDIVFDTFIVAYCVNGHFVYSTEAIERDAGGAPRVFRYTAEKPGIKLADIRRFQFLVPDTTELEHRLDYERRAVIGRGRQFRRGNSISLISESRGKGVANLETEVAQQVMLTDGPYAHSKLVLLTPDLQTFSVADQRQTGRARIDIPITVWRNGATQRRSGTILDFSEQAMRVRLPRDANDIRVGDPVTVQIILAEAEQCVTLMCSVLRRAPEISVLHLEGRFHGDRFVPFTALDFLQLKAVLLNARARLAK